MIKLSDGKKKIELDLPVKVEFEKKEYWIKKSTKVIGIFMNTQPVQEKEDADRPHLSFI